MDETPSRRVSFARQGEETTDDEVLIDDHRHGMCSSGGSERTVRIEVGDEGISEETDSNNVELGSPRCNIIDKAKIESFHHEVCELGVDRFPELCFSPVQDISGNSMLVITQRTVMLHPPFGYTSRIQVTITGFEYEVHVLMKKWESGVFQSVFDVQELCEKFCRDPCYKFCPGIDPLHYKQHYYGAMRFDILSVRQTKEPFARVDSFNCKLWFKLASNATSDEKSSSEVQCSACKRLVTDLNCQRRRTLQESPSRKLKRQSSSSSRARLSYMSPASQQRRKSNAQSERSNMIRKLEKYNESDVTLNDEQHEEMCTLVERIGNGDLDEIFLEGSEHGVGDLMKEIWYTDSKRQQQQFLRDQSKNATGARGNRWSMITIRIALAVYTRSSAAYDALKGFGILQLPSKATLQAYTGAFMHEPGARSECIETQVARYVLFKEQCRETGRQEPRSDGALIFDEVKVACQLMWNSRSHQLMGLAMTHKELPSLNDIYRLLKEPEAVQQTSYILQFLWRDLTSEFDIVGPYFTSPSTVDNKFVMACVMETIYLFQFHELKTSLLVCDGASPNVSVIKRNHGHAGVYSVTEGEDDIFKVEPWMVNPWNPPHRIFWLICPSHQLKNMINALFSSKTSGTKHFQRVGKPKFGWDTIDDLYKREIGRAQLNCARMVPRLKETHCLRDAWTKLNVLPAKIMQQEQVLGELHWYIHQDNTTPEESAKTSETLKYLEACHHLFECGFLSHERVQSLNCDVIKNINKGYHYFSGWLTDLLEHDPQFPHTSNTQKEFLSWQTWDLLRIDVYSFNAFVKWFLETYPTYFISPLRISGSAVESLFSQYKYSAGGKLDAVNYVTSRCSHLVKQCTTSHQAGKGYRDQSIGTLELPLIKHKYGKKEQQQ